VLAPQELLSRGKELAPLPLADNLFPIFGVALLSQLDESTDAVIVDREMLKWFKPARSQFQIYYKSGPDHLEYQPDFVAETADYIYMLEAKAHDEMENTDVLAKKDAAVQWCAHATNYALIKSGGKPWKYVLIPHDAITDNVTVAGFARRFG
jgi:type III restriction enzyme